MTHISTPAIALTALVFMPYLQGCGGCQESALSSKGNVGLDNLDSGFSREVNHSNFMSGDWGLWLSAVTLPDGQVGISFYDKEQGGIAFAYGTPSGDDIQWTYEAIDGYPGANGLDAGDRGMYTSLAVDDNGTLWAAYYDVGARNLRYARRAETPSGIVWVNALADSGEGITIDAGLFASLALQADGRPVIAHYDKGSAALRIAHYNGSDFVGQVLDEGTDREPADTGEDLVEADVGMYACLRIANDQEYLSYYDKANGNLKLAVGNSPNYTLYTIDDGENVGAWPNMVIRGDKIHIAYQDVGKQHLRYAVGKPGGSWDIQKVDRGQLVGADTALFFEGNKPSIVYFDGYGNDMKLARFDGEHWNKSTLSSVGAIGFHNEVISTGDAFYAASYNYTDKNVFFTKLD